MRLNQDPNLRTGSSRHDSLAQDRCAFANLFAGDWLPDREYGPNPSTFKLGRLDRILASIDIEYL